MKLKMRGVEQCFPHSIKVTSKGFSKYLFYGEDTVWNHLSSCPPRHRAGDQRQPGEERGVVSSEGPGEAAAATEG